MAANIVTIFQLKKLFTYGCQAIVRQWSLIFTFQWVTQSLRYFCHLFIGRLNGLSTLVPALQVVFRIGLQGASAGRPRRLTPHRPATPGAAVPIPAAASVPGLPTLGTLAHFMNFRHLTKTFWYGFRIIIM